MKKIILRYCIPLLLSTSLLAQTFEKSNAKFGLAKTNHKHTVNGGFSYNALTGLQSVISESGDTANVFFTAYTKSGIKNEAYWAKRPITFVFNGGPGSSSVWLHMGALGPKRIVLNEDGSAPPAPYSIVDNEYTWLTETDLVFIDPVWTGYSEAQTKDKNANFLGFENDRNLVAEFIRSYLTEHNRWSSPKYLAGESYGTTRASALAYHLHRRLWHQFIWYCPHFFGNEFSNP